MQTETLQKKNLAMVGEEISHELGAQMVKDFQVANPSEVKSYYIGKNIISQILAQPGCVGIKFYNAYNEVGQKTLVYVGVDEFGKNIVEYTVVNNDGSFDKQKAIVADRIKVGSGSSIDNDDDSFSWFSWIWD
jgi:hypothetical protein